MEEGRNFVSIFPITSMDSLSWGFLSNLFIYLFIYLHEQTNTTGDDKRGSSARIKSHFPTVW
jgi:hypothetical protein